MKMCPAIWGLAGLLALQSAPGAAADPFRGHRFMVLDPRRHFEQEAGAGAAETVLTSERMETLPAWDELIVSWNAAMPSATGLKVEARAWIGDGSEPTRWYVMGLWSADAAAYPRESVPGQKDAQGDVLTDTLRLSGTARALQVRLTLSGTNGVEPVVRFLGVCVSDTSAHPLPLRPNRKAWGKTLPVPELTQMAYPNGGVLCSPTTVSMLLRFWGGKMHREDLKIDVPEIAAGIYDAKWHGTGNWVFNMAFAGSQKGMRGCVTRFSDVSELEDWIAAGFPVGLSVCYDLLRGQPSEPSGHLVVCAGFTETGDAIINDPGTRLNVRKTFSRENLIKGWGYSRNTVYLIYPIGARLPKDRFHHWE